MYTKIVIDVNSQEIITDSQLDDLFKQVYMWRVENGFRAALMSVYECPNFDDCEVCEDGD